MKGNKICPNVRILRRTSDMFCFKWLWRNSLLSKCCADEQLGSKWFHWPVIRIHLEWFPLFLALTQWLFVKKKEAVLMRMQDLIAQKEPFHSNIMVRNQSWPSHLKRTAKCTSFWLLAVCWCMRTGKWPINMSERLILKNPPFSSCCTSLQCGL